MTSLVQFVHRRGRGPAFVGAVTAIVVVAGLVGWLTAPV
jgi:hypothetical protein